MISTGAFYSDQLFKEVNLEQANLASNEFHDCTFVRCSFVETTFQDCRFVNSLFQDCDLSLIQVPNSSFTATRFKSSRVVGVNWAEACWPAKNLLDSIGFFECTLGYSTFIGINLRRIQIQNCVAVEVDFRESDLSQANFAGTDLSDSLFLGTDLSEADLSSARNYRIDPSQNVVKKAKFSLPEAISLLFSLDIVLVDQ